MPDPRLQVYSATASAGRAGRCLLLLLLVPLAACAAASIGYSPDGPAKLPAALQPFRGGSVAADGRYAVSAEERALTCPKITGSMQIIMSRLKDSGSRPKSSAATLGLQAAAKPFVGQGTDLSVDHEISTARARLKAYNDLLAQKQCKTLDIAGY